MLRTFRLLTRKVRLPCQNGFSRAISTSRLDSFPQPLTSYIPLADLYVKHHLQDSSYAGGMQADYGITCSRHLFQMLANDAMSATVVAQLLWLESIDPDKPITMYINSPGGSVSAGLAIYDTMNYISPPVSTVCIGMAASMGALLLTGGAAGKRYSLPHSSIMIHQPLGGTRGQASDILIYANQIQRIRRQINEIYRYHLNKSFDADKYDLETVNDMMERDKYLSAGEAKSLGIIDKILVRRDEKQEEKPEKKVPKPLATF